MESEELPDITDPLRNVEQIEEHLAFVKENFGFF